MGSGRAIDIHFTLRANGTEYVTSQLFFDEGLAEELVTTHAAYSWRGSPDTTNSTDGIFNSVNEGTMEWAQRPDGALHAWKVLVISA